MNEAICLIVSKTPKYTEYRFIWRSIKGKIKNLETRKSFKIYQGFNGHTEVMHINKEKTKKKGGKYQMIRNKDQIRGHCM